jgi:hypothetical protein
VLSRRSRRLVLLVRVHHFMFAEAVNAARSIDYAIMSEGEELTFLESNVVRSRDPIQFGYVHYVSLAHRV